MNCDQMLKYRVKLKIGLNLFGFRVKWNVLYKEEVRELLDPKQQL